MLDPGRCRWHQQTQYSYTTPSPRGSWILLMKTLKGLKPDVCLSWWTSAKPPPSWFCWAALSTTSANTSRRSGATIAHHNTTANLPALCSAHESRRDKLEVGSVCTCLPASSSRCLSCNPDILGSPGTSNGARGGRGLVQAGLVSDTGQQSTNGNISFRPRLRKWFLNAICQECARETSIDKHIQFWFFKNKKLIN